ncbi:phosphodiester glycosidase family protein [bacterium]|nr:phosphodiester glycosidase family protein [bacterium]
MLRSISLTIGILILTSLCIFAYAGEIHKAAASGDLARVQELVNDDPTLVNSQDVSGATPLHWAVDRNQRAMVDLLIALGANINAKKKNGVTPTHIAAGEGRNEILEILLTRSADVNAKDNYGRTPISIARYRQKAEAVKILAAHGVSGSTIVRGIETSHKSVSYSRAYVRGHAVNVIYINMDDPSVRIGAAIAKNGIGRSESFGSFMKRLKPTAAINGTFFCNRSLKPIGDIVIGGNMAHFGGMGTGLCITSDNRVSFVSTTRNHHMDWSKYETVIACGPRLLTDGSITLDPYGEGFRDSHVLGSARRTAVGLTGKNRLIFVSTSSACSLYTLASIMSNLGCTDALNFDGGSSSAMHYRGKNISSPGRSLTNVLYVYEHGRNTASR